MDFSALEKEASRYVHQLRAHRRALLGDRFVTEKPRMIAEDFAYYQLNVPGVFVFCGCMDEEHRSPLHADTFDFDERALITGLALFIGLTARKDKENGLV